MSRAGSVRPLVATVGISHPDRLVYHDSGVTKLDLARYYASVAPWMVPHVTGRPLTLVRCPDGAPTAGTESNCFYMKHSKLWAPPALRRVRIREKTKTGEYLIADSPAALVSLVQMGILEVHTWNSRHERIERPDRIVIDIDPGAAVPWPAVVRSARLVRDVLRVLGMQSFVKTTGGRGLHVVVPLEPVAEWDSCLEFARAFAELLVRRDGALYTTNFSKAGREDKILIDYLRNNRTNTSVSAYSTRARAGAPVSVPLSWHELSAATPPDRFNLRRVLTRLARSRSDPWRDYWNAKQRLPRAAASALNRM